MAFNILKINVDMLCLPDAYEKSYPYLYAWHVVYNMSSLFRFRIHSSFFFFIPLFALT